MTAHLSARPHCDALDGKFVVHVTLKCAVPAVECYAPNCPGGSHFLEYQFQLLADGRIFASRYRTSHSPCAIDQFSAEWTCEPEHIRVESVNLCRDLLIQLAKGHFPTTSAMENWVVAAVEAHNAKFETVM